MALPSSGPISLSDVNVELGLSATAQISMNDSAVRTLFGKASGAISMSDGYGKANEFAFTIASNVTNANLRTLAVNAGWNQTSKVVCTINSGIYVSSNSTGTPALTINGSFPGGVELTNNGFIIGRGGNGGRGGGARADFNNAVAGSAGGLALSVSSTVSIQNNGTIGGGGGGGGGGASTQASRQVSEYDFLTFSMAGGGGGGGRSSNAANSSGGAVGQPVGTYSGGNAGGSGTVSSAGAGGAGQFMDASPPRGGNGGTGGNWGANGSGGTSGSGSILKSAAGGGSAGAAVSGNSNITWLATGTRLGAIS